MTEPHLPREAHGKEPFSSRSICLRSLKSFLSLEQACTPRAQQSCVRDHCGTVHPVDFFEVTSQPTLHSESTDRYVAALRY